MFRLASRLFRGVGKGAKQVKNTPKSVPNKTPNIPKSLPKVDPKSLPQDPDRLVQQGWKDVTHPNKAKLGMRELQHPQSNLKVEHHPGTSGKPGQRANDHYHIHNPNATGKHDRYLDINGNPVAKGSKASHIEPSPSPTASPQFKNLNELKNSSTHLPQNKPAANPQIDSLKSSTPSSSAKSSSPGSVNDRSPTPDR
jgi:hypothetical protein